MAANANPDLSTVATTSASAVPSEEKLPVVEVYESGNIVVVKFDEQDATRAPLDRAYTNEPFNFRVINARGREPSIKTFGSLLDCNGGALTIGETRYRIQVVLVMQARSSDPDDIKQLAAFARHVMESNTDERGMSEVSSQWAQELVAALGIVVKTEPINKDEVANAPEPPGYLWQVTTTAEVSVKISEHQGTPGARNWFRNHFLSDDLGKKGYKCEVVTDHPLPRLKAGGKACSGKGDMVIGEKTSIDYADNVYEQAPGLIELKTDLYPIKVGQIILELTAFSMVSRFGRGVVLLASDCNTKWRLAWFQDYNTICRRNYVSGQKCWMDFKEMLLNAEERGGTMEPPAKKRLAVLNEDQEQLADDDQNLEGFEESDVKQKAIDNEALLHQLANHLGDLYGERPVVPDWAKAKMIVPDYYVYNNRVQE